MPLSFENADYPGDAANPYQTSVNSHYKKSVIASGPQVRVAISINNPSSIILNHLNSHPERSPPKADGVEGSSFIPLIKPILYAVWLTPLRNINFF